MGYNTTCHARCLTRQHPSCVIVTLAALAELQVKNQCTACAMPLPHEQRHVSASVVANAFLHMDKQAALIWSADAPGRAHGTWLPRPAAIGAPPRPAAGAPPVTPAHWHPSPACPACTPAHAAWGPVVSERDGNSRNYDAKKCSGLRPLLHARRAQLACSHVT